MSHFCISVFLILYLFFSLWFYLNPSKTFERRWNCWPLLVLDTIFSVAFCRTSFIYYRSLAFLLTFFSVPSCDPLSCPGPDWSVITLYSWWLLLLTYNTCGMKTQACALARSHDHLTSSWPRLMHSIGTPTAALATSFKNPSSCLAPPPAFRFASFFRKMLVRRQFTRTRSACAIACPASILLCCCVVTAQTAPRPLLLWVTASRSPGMCRAAPPSTRARTGRGTTRPPSAATDRRRRRCSRRTRPPSATRRAPPSSPSCHRASPNGKTIAFRPRHGKVPTWRLPLLY